MSDTPVDGRAGADEAAVPPASRDDRLADGWQALASGWIAAERTSWAIVSGFLALPAGGFVAWRAGSDLRGAAFGLGAALLAALAVNALARCWTAARFRHASYRVFADRLALRDGVLWRREIHVPASRVQHIDLAQGPLARRHGFATLVIHTAGSAHARVTVEGLPLGIARTLRDRLVADRADDGV